MKQGHLYQGADDASPWAGGLKDGHGRYAKGIAELSLQSTWEQQGQWGQGQGRGIWPGLAHCVRQVMS